MTAYAGNATLVTCNKQQTTASLPVRRTCGVDALDQACLCAAADGLQPLTQWRAAGGRGQPQHALVVLADLGAGSRGMGVRRATNQSCASSVWCKRGQSQHVLVVLVVLADLAAVLG